MKITDIINESNLNEFVPPGEPGGGGENDRSRRLKKLLEIAIQVAKEKNVDELGMIHAMNMIAGDDFFNTAVEGILPDITDKEYMDVLQTAYKTVKQGMAEGRQLDEQASKLLSAEDKDGVITIIVQAPDGTKRSVADTNPNTINKWLMKYGLRLPVSITSKFVGVTEGMTEAEKTAKVFHPQYVDVYFLDGPRRTPLLVNRKVPYNLIDRYLEVAIKKYNLQKGRFEFRNAEEDPVAEEFRPTTGQAMGIRSQIAQKMNPGSSKFIWKRPNQIMGSHTENELRALKFRYSAKHNSWGGTQQMWGSLEGTLKEFAPNAPRGADRGGGNYFKSLAQAWYYNGVHDGDLQGGVKTQQDVERLLQRGIVCPDGVTRKFGIDYNSGFNGVVISSDDYYEHSDHGKRPGTMIDVRTGRPWGPYDYMEFSEDDLDEDVAEGWGGALAGAAGGGMIGSLIGYPMAGTLLGTWLGSLLTAEKSAEKSSSNNNKRYWVYINGQSPSHNNNDYEPLSLEDAIAQIAAAAEKEHDRKTQYTIVNAQTGQVVFRKYWSDQDDFERGLEPGWQDVEHTETIPPASNAPQRIDPTLDSPPASPKKTVPADFSKTKFSSYKKPGDMEEGIRVPAQQILGTKNRAKSAYYPTNVKPKVPKLDTPLTDKELARLAQLAGINTNK